MTPLETKFLRLKMPVTLGSWFGQYSWNIKRDIGRSSFLSAGCHAVDAMRWFMRDEIEEVCAYSNKRNPDYEYDTNVVGVVRFQPEAAC